MDYPVIWLLVGQSVDPVGYVDRVERLDLSTKTMFSMCCTQQRCRITFFDRLPFVRGNEFVFS